MSRVWPISTFLLSMEFLSLSRRRSSSQNVACGEEQGQMAVIAAWFPRYQFHISSNMKFQRKLCHIQWLPGLCQQTLPELNLFLKFSRWPLKVWIKVQKPTWQLVISSLWRWCPSLQLLLYCCSHFWTSEVLPQPFLKQIFIVLFCLKKKIRNWTLNNY